jgi:pantothenate kinase-related protein Tda10
MSAGLDMSKCCLPDTQQDLLKDIQNWISSSEEGAPWVLWLSGTAGKGKSAVAHTITNWYIKNGGIGLCFCFDLTEQANCNQKKNIYNYCKGIGGLQPYRTMSPGTSSSQS